MEPEDMNSENRAQPDQNQTQPGAGPQPEQKSFFQQERLQRTWLNVKLGTWLKCIIVIAALLVAAAVIAPKLTPAQPQPQQPEQSQQQDTSSYYSEFEDDWYDDYSDDYYYDD